jgi:hypothetical protein
MAVAAAAEPVAKDHQIPEMEEVQEALAELAILPEV